MEREFNYKGHNYWVKVDPTTYNDQTVYIAYVNNDKPGFLLYGEAIKDHNGQTMLFGDELTALTNANAIKQSDIDSKTK